MGSSNDLTGEAVQSNVIRSIQADEFVAFLASDARNSECSFRLLDDEQSREPLIYKIYRQSQWTLTTCKARGFLSRTKSWKLGSVPIQP